MKFGMSGDMKLGMSGDMDWNCGSILCILLYYVRMCVYYVHVYVRIRMCVCLCVYISTYM